MKDALESIPCVVYSIDDLVRKPWAGKPWVDHVNVLTRDNVHTWARENGGPIEITDEMALTGHDVLLEHLDDISSMDMIREIYAAMEAKRREGK